jgi:predicted dehydrogenase
MKTYVIVGTGGRSIMYLDALSHTFKSTSRLAAICDKNPGRLQLSFDRYQKKCPNLMQYSHHDFDKMLAEQKPDYVVVCTKDSRHDDYICKSLEAGHDVITEKPMTIDGEKCQRIVDTVKRTGKSVRVTFNYRYSPPRTQIKDLLMKGTIGKVLSVEFQWMLDTSHGADYFRRWHRNKDNSGGLMVHKASHHFDLVNWWLDSCPVSVFAKGDRVFYNAEQAKSYGLENHGKRCLDCSVKDRCNYYLDMNSYEDIKKLYLDCEMHDGYYRDMCVFGDDIDIEDTMNLVVGYQSGTLLSYSLNAFSPWEGYKVAFNGTKGRLEHKCHTSSYLNGDGSPPSDIQTEDKGICVYPHFQTPYKIKTWEAKGSHGGGDSAMLNDIFGAPENDPYHRNADYIQGAYAILVGIAANMSMKTNREIRVENIVKGLPLPKIANVAKEIEKIKYVKNVIRTVEGVKSLANIPSRIEAPV